jgi:hypothetical protein
MYIFESSAVILRVGKHGEGNAVGCQRVPFTRTILPPPTLEQMAAPSRIAFDFVAGGGPEIADIIEATIMRTLGKKRGCMEMSSQAYLEFRLCIMRWIANGDHLDDGHTLGYTDVFLDSRLKVAVMVPGEGGGVRAVGTWVDAPPSDEVLRSWQA